MNIALLGIDPQNDFARRSGALYVENAENDMARAATMIERIKDKISNIYITIDTHNYFDVGHSNFWINKDGKHPDPIMLISTEDIQNRVWFPAIDSLYQIILDYSIALNARGQHQITVWPVHCLQGSEGQAIVRTLMSALISWSALTDDVDDFKNNLELVFKGDNPYRESYSAFEADVIDANDPSTWLNTSLIHKIAKADTIGVFGEASSHCVAATIRSFVKESPDSAKKIVLLTDAMSPVPGFESHANDFFIEMKMLGVQVSTTTEFMKE